MRKFLLLAMLFSLLGGVWVVGAQSSGLTTSTNQNAVVRSGPGTDFERITVLRGGTAFSIDGRNDNGNWVRGIASNGIVGWVSSGTVNITLNQINGLRVVLVETAFTLSAPAPLNPSSSGPASNSITQDAVVRSGPGTDFERITVLRTGTAFRLDGRNETGSWVRGIASNGIIGWVSSGTVNITSLNSLRIVTVDTPFTLSAPSSGALSASNTTPTTANPPVANNAPVTGFGYGGHVSGLDTAAVNAMYVAGMTWVKFQVRYTDGSSPDGLAGLINNAHSLGFRVLLGVLGQNPGDVNGGGYFDRFAGFVAGAAALGADAIEIWNEPNLDREWPAPIDPARYTELLRVSYNAIKAANPNTLVISGAPAPTGAEAAFPGRVMNDDRFLAGMAAAGAANYMDCVGAHYNEGIVPPTWTSGDPRSEYYTRYLRPMINVYYNAFGGARPVCFTELGYLTSEGYGPLPGFFSWAENVTVADQASWLDGAINISRSSGRVRMVIVWNINFTVYNEDPQAGYAIIRPGGGCPACEALGN